MAVPIFAHSVRGVSTGDTTAFFGGTDKFHLFAQSVRDVSRDDIKKVHFDRRLRAPPVFQ